MTDNHDYNTPGLGEENWHEPLNANFEQLDADVAIRDVSGNRSEYEPKEGAAFVELDTGIVYEGDGSEWSPALATAYYDENGTLVSGDLEVTHTYVSYETDDLSHAIGAGARAVHEGAVVIADSSPTKFWSESSDEVRSQMPIYAPSFNTTSASAAKTDVEPVDPERALEGVRSLDVATWRFTDTDDGRHMGPMAEEFHEAFELGDSDESIATVDADGVAFAAIQGLAAENDRLREELASTEGTVDALEAETEALREEVAALRASVAGMEAAEMTTAEPSSTTTDPPTTRAEPSSTTAESSSTQTDD